jgi:F0F1-type ATP synthase assembly protein I
VSAPLPPAGSSGGSLRPTPPPASGHHDAQWYRRVATKASAEPDTLPEGRVSDDAAWAAVSLMTAGILLYGGIGWLVGHFLGNQSLFVAGGVLFGVVLAMFMLFRRLEPPTARARVAAVEPDATGSRTEAVAPMPVLTDPTDPMESHRVR